MMNFSKLFVNNKSGPKSIKNGAGFTIMEIMVSTVVFTVVFVSLLALFNNVLKINRRAEALRQASQGSRDFIEFIVKEIRNGQIDFGVVDPAAAALSPTYPLGPCTVPANAVSAGANTYAAKENKLGVISAGNAQECFYYGKRDGSYIDSGGAPSATFASSTGGNLVLVKNGVTGPQIINPSNMNIDSLAFYIRPRKDPYVTAGGLAKVQPFVVIAIKFTVALPTGEKVKMNYQTAVSSNKYDIPGS